MFCSIGMAFSEIFSQFRNFVLFCRVSSRRPYATAFSVCVEDVELKERMDKYICYGFLFSVISRPSRFIS